MTIDQELWFQREISRELQEKLRLEQQITREIELQVQRTLSLTEVQLMLLRVLMMQTEELKRRGLPEYRVTAENIHVQ